MTGGSSKIRLNHENCECYSCRIGLFEPWCWFQDVFTENYVIYQPKSEFQILEFGGVKAISQMVENPIHGTFEEINHWMGMGQAVFRQTQIPTPDQGFEWSSHQKRWLNQPKWGFNPVITGQTSLPLGSFWWTWSIPPRVAQGGPAPKFIPLGPPGAGATWGKSLGEK